MRIIALSRTSSFPRSKSLSSSTPRYENVRNVLFFLSSAARAGSVTPESAYTTILCEPISSQHSSLLHAKWLRGLAALTILRLSYTGLAAGGVVDTRGGVPNERWLGKRGKVAVQFSATGGGPPGQSGVGHRFHPTSSDRIHRSSLED